MRIHALFIGFGFLMLAIVVQVIVVQIVRSEELGAQAVSERLAVDEVPARRGQILDRNGVPLATNKPSARVWGVLDNIDDPASVAAALAPHLQQPPEQILERLSTPDVEWVLLAQYIEPEAVSAINELSLEGVVLEDLAGRTYPNGSFASQILGFTNYDGEGSYGLEGYYDETLAGTPGRLVGERDGAGNLIAVSPSSWESPIDGSDLILTIDSGVQRIVEEVLAETVRDQRAAGGTIIVQDPNTGAILGMANLPTFDPNHFDEIDDISVFVNPAISSVYEPGSTFKSIIMAAAIDEGVVTPDTVYDDAPGYIEVPDHAPITNNEGHIYGELTMTEVLVKSSNLGAIYAAQQIGSERLYKRLSQFGFGKTTGVDLQGEERGIMTLPWEGGWNETLFYTNAFGQGIAVTPLQIINAYSAIINGGRLMEPYLVAEEHKVDGTIDRREPEMVREVISPSTSASLREMLHEVVEQRYEAYPQVPGYNIGAKTGTAQVPDPNGGYLEDETIASIIGFGPVENPQFTVLVKIDRPQETPWGETAAGPALGEVLSRLFELYGIPPTEVE